MVMEDSGPDGDELTQFQGGKMKREEEAEKRWMKDFWNLIETVQKVWGGRGFNRWQVVFFTKIVTLEQLKKKQ